MLNDKEAALIVAELNYIRAKLALTPAQLKAMTELDVNTDNTAIMTAMNLLGLQERGSLPTNGLEHVAEYTEQFNRSPNIALICARHLASVSDLETELLSVHEQTSAGLEFCETYYRALGEALLTWALRKVEENGGECNFLTKD